MNDPADFQLVLIDTNIEMCLAFEQHFADLPNVAVVNGQFEWLPDFDCMVSAANSFGLMDGGVDLAITNFFGESLQKRVQRQIIAEYRGEQPVGTSLIVPTQHPQHPYIAHTPTMRVPMQIAGTDNAYTAMWAMLLAVWRHNRDTPTPPATASLTAAADRTDAARTPGKIGIVACPGLGTGIGRIAPDEAGRQMALAYQHFLDPPQRIHWPYATRRQGSIGRGGDYWASLLASGQAE